MAKSGGDGLPFTRGSGPHASVTSRLLPIAYNQVTLRPGEVSRLTETNSHFTWRAAQCDQSNAHQVMQTFVLTAAFLALQLLRQ